MPPALVMAVTRVAPLLAAGQVAPAGAISARVASLTQGVIRAMILTKLKIATALFLVLALLAVGATLYEAPAAPQTSSAREQVTPPKKAQSDTGTTGKPNPGITGSQAPIAPPVTLRLPAVVIDEVDFKHKTISVTIVEVQTGSSSSTSSSNGASGSTSGTTSSGASGKATKLVNLPVHKNVEIVVNNETVPLGGLKPGMKVSLQLVVNSNDLVVTSATTDRPERDGLKGLALKVKQADAQLAVARATAEQVAVQLEAARLELANAQGAEAREKAHVEVERASAQLQAARANAELAARLAVRLAKEYEHEQKRKN